MIDFGSIPEFRKKSLDEQLARFNAPMDKLQKFVDEADAAAKANEQEPSITIELRKDDVIRMLKGSNAPAGMLWDERSMNEYSIEDLIEIYAQLNWSGQPVQEQEAPRIFVPGAQ